MSTGLFMGIRSSFVDEAQDSAIAFVEAINDELAKRGITRYVDSTDPPDVYKGHLFGRSELDHHSSRVLVDIASFATTLRECENLALIQHNPFRVAFLPRDFSPPLLTGYFERIGGEPIQIRAGSLPRLMAELSSIAAVLGIPMANGILTDDVATAINTFEGLDEGDSAELSEDQRTAWLVLYEGTRLALEHSVALSLAG